jgi:hypothetical protein
MKSILTIITTTIKNNNNNDDDHNNDDNNQINDITNHTIFFLADALI